MVKTLTQKKAEDTYKKRKKLIMAKAEKIAAPLREKLAKDADWPLVVGTKKCETNEDYTRERRAKNRIIKRAIQILLPELKVSVQYGRGTAHDWVYVNFKIPEIEYKKLPKEKLQSLQRIENILIALGIRFATYYTDNGLNDHYSPCLMVTRNYCSI